MPKSRMMGAGLSGSSAYNTSVNSNQGGGNKKGGLPGTIGLGVTFALRRVNQHAYSSPEQRRQVYCMNQIGGVGAMGGRSRRHASSADGVKDCISTPFTPSNSELYAAVSVWLKNASLAEETYGHISTWNTSEVTSMKNLFYRELLYPTFNEDLNSWDTSAVTDMSYMFRGCIAYDQDMSGWDTSNVTDMGHMFHSDDYADGDGYYDHDVEDGNAIPTHTNTAFTGKGLSAWDVSKVTSMYGMFAWATDFNGNISGWDVGKVESFRGTFAGANAFDANITGWDVCSATNMRQMFYYNLTFNQPIGNWGDKVSKVTNMYMMFLEAEAFNQDLSKWTVGAVTNMYKMFLKAEAFNQDLSKWTVDAVTDMDYMFYNAKEFNNDGDSDLSNWNIDNWEIAKPVLFATGSGGTTDDYIDKFIDFGITWTDD
jgi:surface protein